MLANGQKAYQCRNYATLSGAWACRDVELNKETTRKVEIMQVLDESTPAHHRREDPRTTAIKAFRIT
jgi:hypothetical protein